ncbi:MAG: hypothetical protein ACD_19C00230G0004 [uncultured bacterium]|nr:MAG: hypothetical protein ACD_19C00230G0004 [uncultured bacterium]HCS40911.1 hypothetical protein [Anaerolineaceae bacterium]
MIENENEILVVLQSIEDKLNRIYLCFENQYFDIQNQKNKEKLELFKSIITDNRKKIFPLIFDSHQLSQKEIADKVGVTRQAVGKFINQLIENDLIVQKTEADKTIYEDKFNLVPYLEKLK